MDDELDLFVSVFSYIYGERLGKFDTEEQAQQVIDNCEDDIKTVLNFKGYL